MLSKFVARLFTCKLWMESSFRWGIACLCTGLSIDCRSSSMEMASRDLNGLFPKKIFSIIWPLLFIIAGKAHSLPVVGFLHQLYCWLYSLFLFSWGLPVTSPPVRSPFFFFFFFSFFFLGSRIMHSKRRSCLIWFPNTSKSVKKTNSSIASF